MYDIYDDELKEMYESKRKTGVTLDKNPGAFILLLYPHSTLLYEKFLLPLVGSTP